MRVTIEDLADDPDDDFLDLNKHLLEKLAVHTLVDIMSGTEPADIKLDAAKTVLGALGKSKPTAPALPAPNTNIQINTFLPHMAEAVRSLGPILNALPGGSNEPSKTA